MARSANVTAYLDRINYTGPTAPNADTLRGIHRAHMLAVPFENLDIPLKREIVIDENAFLRKIVDQRRGGFCYEMNGALAALLRELGFEVTLLSARVPREDGSPSPEFDHLTLRVDLDDPWLADVGFGDCFLDPLRLQVGEEQTQHGQTFRIMEINNSLHVQRAEADCWKNEYMFTLQPRQLADFAPMCHYHQTSPESPFTRKRLCTLATPNGRITVADMKLITAQNGEREERLLSSENEWRNVLRETFGVVL